MESCENKDVVGFVEREAETIASRILVSSFLATISAAFPLGARMKGTWPKSNYCQCGEKPQSATMNVPSVAIALNKPFATLSISSSICCSVDDGEFRMIYVEWGMLTSGAGGVVVWTDGGGEGGGRRENREGEGAMKDKY